MYEMALRSALQTSRIGSVACPISIQPIRSRSELKADIEFESRETRYPGVGHIGPLLPETRAEEQPAVHVPTQSSADSEAEIRCGFCRLRHTTDVSLPGIPITSCDGRSSGHIGVDVRSTDIPVDIRRQRAGKNVIGGDQSERVGLKRAAL